MSYWGYYHDVAFDPPGTWEEDCPGCEECEPEEEEEA
jgi:hypothetical protein